MRAVGVWPLADGGEPIVVWQINADAIADEDGVWDFVTAQRDGSGGEAA
eukprot:gene15843-31322_t